MYSHKKNKSFLENDGTSHTTGDFTGDESVRDVDLIPMINVVFLLLIFFMVAGVFRAVDKTPLTLPATQMTVPAHENTVPQISIDALGTVLVDGENQSVDQLTNAIRRLDNTIKLTVRADSNAPANTVIQVFSLARDAGFKEVGLQATSKAESALP